MLLSNDVLPFFSCRSFDFHLFGMLSKKTASRQREELRRKSVRHKKHSTSPQRNKYALRHHPQITVALSLSLTPFLFSIFFNFFVIKAKLFGWWHDAIPQQKKTTVDGNYVPQCGELLLATQMRFFLPFHVSKHLNYLQKPTTTTMVFWWWMTYPVWTVNWYSFLVASECHCFSSLLGGFSSEWKTVVEVYWIINDIQEVGWCIRHDQKSISQWLDWKADETSEHLLETIKA